MKLDVPDSYVYMDIHPIRALWPKVLHNIANVVVNMIPQCMDYIIQLSYNTCISSLNRHYGDIYN